MIYSVFFNNEGMSVKGSRFHKKSNFRLNSISEKGLIKFETSLPPVADRV